jgi:hypothetical protein
MSTTATNTTVGTRVNASARSVTYVANEIIRVGLEITQSRGLSDGPLVRSFKSIETGLRVWLATRQLHAVLIEFLNERDECIEAFELPIEFSEARTDDEHFDTQIDSLKANLAKRRTSKATKYRFLVAHSDDHIRVPGWTPCERSDTSKLKKRNLLMRLVSTRDIKVHAYVFEGENDYETQS